MQLEHSFTVPVGIDKAWATLLDVETIAPCMPGAALDTVDGDEFTGTVKVKLGPIGLTYKGRAAFVEKDAAMHRAVIDAQGRDARGNGTAKAMVTATLTPHGAGTEVKVETDLNITGKPAQFGRGVMVDVGNKLIGQFADCLSGKLTATDAAPTAAASSGDGGPAGPAGSADGGSPTSDGADGPASVPTSASADTGGGPAGSEGSGGPDGSDGSDGAGVTAPAPAPASPSGSATPGAAVPADAPAVPSAPHPVASGPRHVAPAPEVEPIDLMASAGPAVAKRLLPAGVGLVAVLVALIWWRRR